MATAFDLPSSPTLGQTDTLPGGTVVEWDGKAWIAETNNTGGGGSNTTIDDVAPVDPAYGDRWIKPATGQEAVWVETEDGLGAWYVPAGPIGQDIDADAFLLNTTDTFTGTLTMTGSIIPSADITYDLGSPEYQWRDMYVGPGSIYMNGKKILEDNSDTITFSTDPDQNLRVQTTGTGNIEIMSENGAAILLKGTVNVSAGKKIISSDGNKIEFGDDIDVGVNKITSTAIPSGNADLANKLYVDGKTTSDATIVRTTGTQTIDGAKTFTGNTVINGNLTVSGTVTTVNSETVSVADNILELNSNFTTGSPTENSGFLVRRGDLGTVQWIWDEANDRFTGISGTGAVQSVYVGGLTATGTTTFSGATTFSGSVTGLTKSVVGLSNVDNTADTAKPVSTATQTALDAKASASTVSSHIANTSNPHAVTKTQVGLGNVDNTSDFYKDVQSARTVRNGANSSGTAMVFNWSGQDGQPSWLWGGNDGGNMYVYNPSNFSVSYAASAGWAASTGTINGASGGNLTSGIGLPGSATMITANGYQAHADRSHIYLAVANPNYTQMTIEAIHYHGSMVTWRMYVNGQSFDHRHDGWGECPAGWRVTSDRRKKENLAEIKHALAKMRKLVGYTFDRPDLASTINGTSVVPRQAGLIAQDAQNAVPEAVAEGEDGYLKMSYDGITALLTNAINELHDRVEALENHIYG